jgi:hypothetical protein
VAGLLAHDTGRRYERSQPRIELPMITLWDDVPADGLFPDRLVPVCALDLPPDCQGEYIPLQEKRSASSSAIDLC